MNRPIKLATFIFALVIVLAAGNATHAYASKKATKLLHVYDANCRTDSCFITITLKYADGRPVPDTIYHWQYKVNGSKGEYPHWQVGDATLEFSLKRKSAPILSGSDGFLIEARSLGKIGLHDSSYEFVISNFLETTTK